MAKKIYDILPPKMANKVEDTVKSMGGSEGLKKQRGVTAKKRNQKKRFPLWEISIGCVVVVLLVGIYFFNTLPRATIQIWPQTNTLSLQDTITANTSQTSVDAASKIIPARVVKASANAFREFSATGSTPNDGEATGTITVYNKITPPSPLSLKAGTHFLSDSGKYFVTLAKITIPAAQGGTAGSVNVNVQAVESGADYNIGSSKFSVPGLSGTAYYYNVWGESANAMSGGHTGTVEEVTDQDIQNAQDSLTKTLFSQAETSLKSKLAPDEILLDSATVQNVDSASPNVKSGTVINKFTETASVTVSALVFKKEDLQGFVQNDINAQLQSGQQYLPNSLQINDTAGSVDMTGGTATINVSASAKTYNDIDTVGLIDLISQKTAPQIQQIISQQYNGAVSEIKINFWPWWVHSSPSDQNRITINLNF